MSGLFSRCSTDARERWWLEITGKGRKTRLVPATGELMTEPVLKALSPYRTSHINRFGDYTLDLGRAIEPIDYKIKFS